MLALRAFCSCDVNTSPEKQPKEHMYFLPGQGPTSPAQCRACKRFLKSPVRRLSPAPCSAFPGFRRSLCDERTFLGCCSKARSACPVWKPSSKFPHETTSQFATYRGRALPTWGPTLREKQCQRFGLKLQPTEANSSRTSVLITALKFCTKRKNKIKN